MVLCILVLLSFLKNTQAHMTFVCFIFKIWLLGIYTLESNCLSVLPKCMPLQVMGLARAPVKQGRGHCFPMELL